MSESTFILHSSYTPSGDQPEAIAKIISGINSGATHQTLKGITGSGKTFTMANIIHRLKRPTLILAPNKTLTAQLFDEMSKFFPENAVEFFVSYYDYFQPEMYLPGSDRYIQKDSSINEQLERLRLSTTKSLIERRDTIVIASVSSIYGLGDPDDYRALQAHLAIRMPLTMDELKQQLENLQYAQVERNLKRGTYRINDDVIDIFPADSEFKAVNVVIVDSEIQSLKWVDSATGLFIENIDNYAVSPKTLFAPSTSRIDSAAEQILKELNDRIKQLTRENRIIEADRLHERVTHDVEMLQSVGYCSGMENYACYFNERNPTLPPTTLLDYLPKDGLLFVDESHVMLPQILAMYRGDQSRKDTLIDYGFRLPSSKRNHPLSFAQFEEMKPQTIFVSATPGDYELRMSKDLLVEQIVRPTGLLDPIVEVRPSAEAIDDLLNEIQLCIGANNRVLITALTKIEAENLHKIMEERNIRSRYLHSGIKTTDRTEILNGLRAGEFDVLIGISLLREGLDLPEAALIVILHADHAGFLRSSNALIQMIGRVARNLSGKAIMYADSITPAMKVAIDETSSRRERQITFNEQQQVTPVSSTRKLNATPSSEAHSFNHPPNFCRNLKELCIQITDKENELLEASNKQEEGKMEEVRSQLNNLYRQFIYV